MRKSFLPVLALAAALAVWVAVPATGDDGDKPPKQPRGNGQGSGPGGGMRPGPMQPASICALGNALYVVRGSTIYKIDPETLQVVKKATYAEDEMKQPKPPDGGGEGGPEGGPEGGGPGR